MDWAPLSQNRQKSTISIYKQGVIVWNEETHKLLGDPLYVEVLLDRERKLLGLRGCSDKGGNSFVVKPLGSQMRINALGALRDATNITQLPATKTRREGAVIYVDISDFEIKD